jgi:hypothetical protein
VAGVADAAIAAGTPEQMRLALQARTSGCGWRGWRCRHARADAQAKIIISFKTILARRTT